MGFEGQQGLGVGAVAVLPSQRLQLSLRCGHSLDCCSRCKLRRRLQTSPLLTCYGECNLEAALCIANGNGLLVCCVMQNGACKAGLPLTGAATLMALRQLVQQQLNQVMA